MNLLSDPPSAARGGEGGAFAGNIVHFVRLLRASGLRLGPGKALDAVRAVEAAGIRRRDDLYWTLFSVLVNRCDQRELFDQAFEKRFAMSWFLMRRVKAVKRRARRARCAALSN